MRAPGALLRSVEGCLGGTLGAPGSPKKKFEKFGVPFKSHKSAQITPKCSPRGPKTSPKEPPNTFKSICIAKTLTYHKSVNPLGKIKVFEGRRVRLGCQIRHQARGSKIRKTSIWKRTSREGTNKAHKYGNTRS